MSVLEAVATGFDNVEEKPFKPSASLIADRILQDANHRYPGFIVAQAAHIALFAQVEGISPIKLKESLLADTERINNLVEEANYYRIPYIGTTEFEDEELSIMTAEQMEEVVTQNFETAKLLTSLHPDKLKILTSRYSLYYDQGQTESMEVAASAYQSEAANMLAAQFHP